MEGDKAFSTDFIIKDLTESYFSTPTSQRRVYSKLVETLRAGRIQILVEDEGSDHFEQLNNEKGDSEIGKAKFELLHSLVSSGKINFVSSDTEVPECLSELKIRTSHKKKFSYAAKNSVGAALFNELPEKAKNKIGRGLKKALIGQFQFSDESIEYLFDIQELEPITKGKHFDWYEYLKPYAIHTNRIYIRDQYFYSNNLNSKLYSLLGPLLSASYSTPIQVEIISKLERNIPKSEAQQKVQEWVEQHDDRLDIHCFYTRNHVSALFHDRYLFTDYWALKIPAGLDVEKNEEANKYTIPTLVGRYSATGETWKYINENWEEWKNKKCKKISTK